jgi:hypothetical protein
MDNDCAKEDSSFKQFIIRVAVGKPKQANLRCKAMIDTGASCSFISKDMIAGPPKQSVVTCYHSRAPFAVPSCYPVPFPMCGRYAILRYFRCRALATPGCGACTVMAPYLRNF